MRQQTPTLPTGKQKRHPSLIKQIRLRMQWGQSFDYHVNAPVRTCTRRLSELVCYPNAQSNLRRVTDFIRIENNAYAFEIRSKHYLGRGTYYLLARMEGTLIYDEARQLTQVHGVISVGLFYLVATICMSIATLTSALIMQETMIFLPLWLLMGAMCLSHWWYLYSQWRLLRHDFEQYIVQKDHDPEETVFSDQRI